MSGLLDSIFPPKQPQPDAKRKTGGEKPRQPATQQQGQIQAKGSGGAAPAKQQPSGTKTPKRGIISRIFPAKQPARETAAQTTAAPAPTQQATATAAAQAPPLPAAAPGEPAPPMPAPPQAPAPRPPGAAPPKPATKASGKRAQKRAARQASRAQRKMQKAARPRNLRSARKLVSALVKQRETMLRDLGGLMFEMHRRERFRKDLIDAKCVELGRIDMEIRRLTRAINKLPPLESHPGTAAAGPTEPPRAGAPTAGTAAAEKAPPPPSQSPPPAHGGGPPQQAPPQEARNGRASQEDQSIEGPAGSGTLSTEKGQTPPGPRAIDADTDAGPKRSS